MSLLAALAWRGRREGLPYVFIPVGLFAALVALLFGVASSGQVNGAQQMANFAERYGAHGSLVIVGLGLLLGPGLVALFTTISVAMLVRNLIGSEASRGGLELLLAAPYRPRTIMTALLGYAAVVATAYWALMTGLAAVALAVVCAADGASVTLTGSYLAAALPVPLLGGWAAAALAVGVNLLYPRLAQVGSYGIHIGGGGISGLPPLLPGLAIFLSFAIWAPHIGVTALVAIVGGGTAAITVLSIAVVAVRFRPDGALES